MSAFERFGTRDLGYSRWHRQKLRDLSEVAGATCGMVDVDCLEYCARCKMNLFLIETAQDIGQAGKATTQLEQLAASANLPAFCVLYTRTEEECPNTRRCHRAGCQHGISTFRVRRVAPIYDDYWTTWTPDDLASWILNFHEQHEAVVCGTTWMTGGAA